MKMILVSIALAMAVFFNMGCAKSHGNSKEQAHNQAQVNPGQFISIGNHSVQGGVQIDARPEGLFLVLDQNFKSSSGPDLRVVLRDSTGATMMLVVAALQNSEGAQEYPLNLDVSALDSFDEVSIYCAKFHVDFGVAILKNEGQ